ncbi:hypothetical protein F8C76_06710 [Flagellimonas olearia]|uniref:Fibronectin type-III domain-containing protein n=1 Tax=Flagellimonas olearia TaxID=552546 RepID=A0A6I1E5S9_9FLAO|nr:hypothetical protein [Allomuricauda olearia]KAB7531181.1 hypothetical protein F8C76_06710 [Allomuricauda olearia]
MRLGLNWQYIMLLLFVVGCSKGGSEETDPPDDDPISENNPPSVPLLVYPTNDLLCIDNELEFSWHASEDVDGDPITYMVEVAYDEDFSSKASEISTSNLSADILLEKGSTLFWRVKALDNNSNGSEFSNVWKFYTEAEATTNNLPSQPELIAPVLNANVTGNSITLEWFTSDEDGDVLMFDLYFGTDANPPLYEEEHQSMTYSVSIETGNQYFWKIVSKDGKGGVSIGPVWNFKAE